MHSTFSQYSTLFIVVPMSNRVSVFKKDTVTSQPKPSTFEKRVTFSVALVHCTVCVWVDTKQHTHYLAPSQQSEETLSLLTFICSFMSFKHV